MTEKKDQTSRESEGDAPAAPKAEAEAKTKAEAKAEPKEDAKEDAEEKPTAEPRRSGGSLRNKVRWAKRIVVIVLLILLVLLLLSWKYCKQGSGSGGLKAADGSQTQGVPAQMTASAARKANQPPCRLRVDKKGVSQKGKVLTIPEAVKACRGARRAELTVTGDATFGQVKQLRQALRAAGIAAVRR